MRPAITAGGVVDLGPTGEIRSAARDNYSRKVVVEGK